MKIVTSPDIESYKQKIEETFKYGGDQLLLQVAITRIWVLSFTKPL